MSHSELVLKLLLQIAIILIACRIATFVGKRFFAQTSVVCEMITGILLGPSVFGYFFPNVHYWLFPIEPYLLANGNSIPNPSMSILYAISQLGLVLYMFLVGMEFNTSVIKLRFKHAFFISTMGIIIPFTLGILFISQIPASFDLFNINLPFSTKYIFMGIALSVTAFPVMARILDEKNAMATNFGSIALAAGSFTDLFAWIMLALLFSHISGNSDILLVACFGTFFYIILMLVIKKPLEKILTKKNIKPLISVQTFGVIIAILMICAWFTDSIGIHLVFGAFFAGVIVPKNKILLEQIQLKIGDLTKSILLPTFFVFSGLNTHINLINSLNMYLLLGILLLVAIIGKGFSCMLASRLLGESWRESLLIGTLMNTRGLMELIILNIGLQKNIITPQLFTVLVIVAILTTLLTVPLYNFICKKTKV